MNPRPDAQARTHVGPQARAQVSAREHRPTLERTLLIRDAKFDVERVDFVSSRGDPISRTVVRHPGSVVLVPMPTPDRVVLIRTYRPALDAWNWEFPAGTRGPDEPYDDCARRELAEEIGAAAATLTEIARFHPGPGMTDELMKVYLATSITMGSQHLEPDEDIRPVEMHTHDLERMIDTADIIDAKTIAAWHITRRYLDRHRHDGPRATPGSVAP
ncbi:MAG: NUDIX hydrolase [Phycisphaerales bacterium]